MSLRVAVIGCGPIGNRHADLYQADPLAELVAVCDIRKDRCDTAAQRLGVPGFYDAPTMLATIKPDLACAKKHQRCFAIDFNHRFTDAAKVAKKWVDDGLIGHQLFINMSMWIKNPNESSPFYMIKALNPHSVDVMRHFGGDICAVHAFCTTAPGRTIHTTMSMNVRFTSGAVGHLSASYDIERGHPMERCEVAGVKGRLVLDDMWREATLYPAGNPIKQVYTNPVFGGHRDFVDTFRNRIHRFLEQVSAGTAPDAIDGSGADGLAAQKVLQGAIDSVVTGGVIQL